MQHFLNIESLSAADLQALLNSAAQFLDHQHHLNIPEKFKHHLQHQYVAALFLEPSTRTRISFEIAAQNLGARFIHMDESSSSIVKGETLLDTLLNLEAMDIRHFVIRIKSENLLEETIPFLKPSTRLICAGEGTRSHPTQALLDMLTIQRHCQKPIDELKIVIAGDVKYSRVARSDIAALQLLGAKHITIVAPPIFQADDLAAPNIHITTSLDDALQDADVLMLLRIQTERMEPSTGPDLNYHREYGLTHARLNKLKPNCIVMHPGPINRGVEIADDVLHDKRVLIQQQVTYGVAARMAVLQGLD